MARAIHSFGKERLVFGCNCLKSVDKVHILKRHRHTQLLLPALGIGLSRRRKIPKYFVQILIDVIAHSFNWHSKHLPESPGATVVARDGRVRLRRHTPIGNSLLQNTKNKPCRFQAFLKTSFSIVPLKHKRVFR